MMMTQQTASSAVEAHEAWFAAKVLAALEDTYTAEPVSDFEVRNVETN